MAASPTHSTLPVRTTTTNKIPVSTIPVLSPRTPHKSHIVPVPHVICEKRPSASRVPSIPRDSRVTFKNIRNIPSPPSAVPITSLRASKLPITQLKQPSTTLGAFHSPPSKFSALTSPAASPLVIPKTRDHESNPGGVAFSSRHVRFRHRMTPSSTAMVIPAIPPFKASSTKKPRPAALAPASYSQSLPPSSRLVDSESFDVLKQSNFNKHYQPSASIDSLAAIRGVSDEDRGQGHEKSRLTDYRNVHSFVASSRHDGTQVTYIMPLVPRSEHPSVEPCDRPALTSPAVGLVPATKLPTLLASRPRCKNQPTGTLTTDKAIGFPMDMLDMIGNLETLAGEVKTLEVPSRVLKPKRIEGGRGDAVRKQGNGESINGHGKMLTNGFRSVDCVSTKLEKGKWRAIGPDVRDYANQNSETSASDTDFLPLGLLNPTITRYSNPQWCLYNPCDAPEFLAGCSTSPVLYRAYGYHSKPPLSHQRAAASRKLSLPSRLPLRKRQCYMASAGRFWESEQQTGSSTEPPSMPPLMPSPSPPSKSSTLKSLLQRSRPRSRSDITKPNTSSIPVSHRPVENLFVREGLPKPRFHWLKL